MSTSPAKTACCWTRTGLGRTPALTATHRLRFLICGPAGVKSATRSPAAHNRNADCPSPWSQGLEGPQGLWVKDSSVEGEDGSLFSSQSLDSSSSLISGAGPGGQTPPRGSPAPLRQNQRPRALQRVFCAQDCVWVAPGCRGSLKSQLPPTSASPVILQEPPPLPCKPHPRAHICPAFYSLGRLCRAPFCWLCHDSGRAPLGAVTPGRAEKLKSPRAQPLA